MKHVPQGHGSKDGTRTKGTARAHQAGHQPECHARHHGTKTTEQNQGAKKLFWYSILYLFIIFLSLITFKI